MYTPKPYREERADVLIKAIGDLQFATLITAHPGGYHATHLPMLARATEEGLVLEAHMARANPHWQALPLPSLAIFQGPHAYISPSWYESAAEHRRVVPTWNYIAVHAHVRLEAIEDPEWLAAQIDELTNFNETARAPRWRLADADGDYVERLRGAIVGLRLRVTQLDGAWKMNQIRPEADRLATIAGLAASELPGDHDMAEHLRALEAERTAR